MSEEDKNRARDEVRRRMAKLTWEKPPGFELSTTNVLICVAIAVIGLSVGIIVAAVW